MAILTPVEKQAVRALYAGGTVNHPKSTLDAAIQAIEDVFDAPALRNAISNAIDAAIAPATMTGPEKTRLVRWTLRNRLLVRE